jgi:hypothetical protein
VSDDVTLCTVCGLPLEIGQWPCVFTPRPHGRSVQTAPFIPYFDFALGREITSLGDRWAAMKGTIDPESGTRVGQMDYRDKMSPGDLSARRERIEQQKREQARG